MCGGYAAVGWEIFSDDQEVSDQPAGESPVEFECPTGCRFPAMELTRFFAPH
jgi:hypothetical protein